MFNLDLQISEFFFELGRALPLGIVNFLATYLFWILVVLVIFISLKNHAPRFILFMYAATSGLIVYYINKVIGFYFFRERPYISLGFENLLGEVHPDKSFPSDHTSLAWTMALMVFLYNKKYGVFLLAIALLVSISRILAGVHYISDILGGIVVGTIIALFVYWLTKRSWIKKYL
tara:strand:- start:16 stop:540 length:525 start_codon:yes stop_codon:yes gene_type:complete